MERSKIQYNEINFYFLYIFSSFKYYKKIK